MERESRKPLKSSSLKSGKRTFFFDVQLSVNNKKYLKVTESRVPEEGEEKGKRNSFVIFPEDVENFRARLDEAANYLAQ